MDANETAKNITKTIKELLNKSKNDPQQLSKMIDTYLITQQDERDRNAEVSTPYKLRKDMLDALPQELFKSVNTVFEPCSGKGGFLIDIVSRFMDGLSDKYPDEQERYKTIVEKCIYFADINPMNIFINKLLLDSNNVYKLNYYTGNTLEIDIQKEFDISGFDAIISNPPYNSSGAKNTGNTIWQKFTRQSLVSWLNDNGYLCSVHPFSWRKPNTSKSPNYGMYELMAKKNHMIKLSIHSAAEGNVTFNCGTSYDWYVIKKSDNKLHTDVKFMDGSKEKVKLQDYDWLPNSNLQQVQKLLANADDRRCPIIYNRSSYPTENKKRISKTKTDEFIYPIIHSIHKNKTINYRYSNDNGCGHFGVSKVIFGDNGLNDVIIDMNGEYGMTEHSMAIKVNTKSEAENIKKALLDERFKNLLFSSMVFGNFAIDWRLFSYFKEDFWKEYVTPTKKIRLPKPKILL